MRRQILIKLRHSPSLRRYLENALEETYRQAIKDALDETGLAAEARKMKLPKVCPYSLAGLLEDDLGTLAQRLTPDPKD